MACPGSTQGHHRHVERCQKQLRFLGRGLLSFEEYALNVTSVLLFAPAELLLPCLETIPSALLPRYRKYLHDSLVSVDFKPSPAFYLTGDFTPDRIEHKKVELRPRYLAIYQLVTANPDSANQPDEE
jgi:hypothetical protein